MAVRIIQENGDSLLSEPVNVMRDDLARVPDGLLVECEDILGTAKEVREVLGVGSFRRTRKANDGNEWF